MKGTFAAALLAVLFSAGLANAATVTGVYYGELTSSSDPAFPTLSIGDRYRIEFSCDTSVPDGRPGPEFGQYLGALSGNVTFSNGFHLSFSGGFIDLGNDVEAGDSDYINFGSLGGALSAPGFPTDLYALDRVGWSLIDFDRRALSSDHLPPSYLSAALFDRVDFGILFVGLGRPNVFLSGTLTSTPIPPALPLFAAALGGLGILGWHRRKSTEGAA